MPLHARPKPALRILAPRREPDTSDLSKLEASVNATSQKAVAQWIAFLSLWAYLFFTTLSVTDRDLVLLTPVKLPLIGVELGLQAFFWTAPPLFWVFHLYLIRKVVVLSKDLAYYREQIARQIRVEGKREPLYRRLDAFFLTRLLGHIGRGNGLQWLDSVIAGMTIVVLPLTLMLAFQIRFLAFHDVLATWWHRGWALAELGLVAWIIFRALKVRRAVAGAAFSMGKAEWHGLLRGCSRVAIVPVGLAYGLFSLLIATVPDEGVIDTVADLSTVSKWMNLPRYLAPHDTDFVNDDKIDKVQATLDLRGRDLRGAALENADLRKASLDGAQLQNAYLGGAQLQEASLKFSSLHRAHLYDAQLERAILDRAWLQGVQLNGANLKGASLKGAILQGADLSHTEMQGAVLDFSKLQMALMDFSELSGASLLGVQAQGASFNQANLIGAHLYNANFQGASFSSARFQGADLVRTDLQGTVLDYAEFQGASLKYTRLDGASLDETQFWRTDVRFTQSAKFILSPVKLDFTPYSRDQLDVLIEKWEKSIPSGKTKDAAINKFGRLKKPLSEQSDLRTKKLFRKLLKENHYGSGEEIFNFVFNIFCNDENIRIYNITSNYIEDKSYLSRYWRKQNPELSKCLVSDETADHYFRYREKVSYWRSITTQFSKFIQENYQNLIKSAASTPRTDPSEPESLSR